MGPKSQASNGGGPKGEDRRVGPKPRENLALNFGAPKGGVLKGGAPKGGAPKGAGPKLSRFFSPLPPHFRSFCLSLGVFSWNFGGVFEGRRTQMCTFGVLGLSCEVPAAPKPSGFHTTTREPKRAHLRATPQQTPPKFNEKTPRERQKERKWGGRGEKKERNFGRSGGGGSGVGWGRVQTNNTQHNTTTHNNTQQHQPQHNTTKMDWPKNG